MFVLLESPYVVISRLPGLRIIRFKRLAESAKDVESVHKTFQDCIAALDSVDRTQHGLLADLREGPMRNDPQFEGAFMTYSQRLYGDFAAVATLAKTSVGKLQLNRFAKMTGISMTIFDDEGEAIRFLRELLPKPR
jgi:hypothetical protein